MLVLAFIVFLTRLSTASLDVNPSRSTSRVFKTTLSLDNNSSVTLAVDLSRSIALPPSPCHLTKDLAYHGVSVNCQRKGISSLPVPQNWIPSDTTSLLLDYNELFNLNNQSFSTFTLTTRQTLRCLSISNNHIRTVGPYTFSELTVLEKLVLDANHLRLDRNTLSGLAFRGLGCLMELNLVDNGNKDKLGNYPDALFSGLKNLATLSLDTFMGELDFGSLFNTTERLSSLTLSGGVKVITNDSFEGLQNLQLKSLTLSSVGDLISTEPGAFRYLRYLESYHLSDSSQSVKVTLDSFSPFIHRNMSQITILDMGRSYQVSKIFSENSVISRHMARYLSEICVEHFTLSHNLIFIIQVGVLTSSMWQRCLKTLDISKNPLQGEQLAFLLLATLRKLETFNMMNRKYVFARNIDSTIWYPPVCKNVLDNDDNTSLSRLYLQTVSSSSHGNARNIQDNPSFLRDTSTNLYNQDDADVPEIDLWAQTYYKRPSNLKTPIHEKGTNFIYLPKQLKRAYFNGLSYNMLHLRGKTIIKNGQNLEELHLADTGIKYFTGALHGLTNLKLVDLSTNDASVMSDSFFDFMPTVVHLNVANMKFDPRFMADNSKRIFLNLTEVTTLDISNNQLKDLSPGTFATNSKLTVLRLADNRFQSIPFHLRYLPKLCWLDLSGNSLRGISDIDAASLEQHADAVKTFSLTLNGNDFQCGCESIKFLSWLQRTDIKLDNNRNYSCLLDSGIRTSTTEFKDLEATWRLCHGEKALWCTLTLMFSMIFAFLCAVMLPKFKTQLTAYVLKLFWSSFIIKTPADYPIGVYIGYADQETNLACRQLREFIECKLHLTTYVRHRDLLPASDMAESIMEAVNSSWRVLLMVSTHFLDDPWTYFLLKASTFAVKADNPGRIVMILIDDGDQSALVSRLPDCIFQAVLEENIISMTSIGHISYDDRHALKTALLN